MIEKFELKIIRMKTGEDLIGFCFEDRINNKIIIKYPKTFYSYIDPDTSDEEIVLIDWLPKLAFYSQEVKFDSNNVLFSSYTNTAFGYQYLSVIQDSLDETTELATKIQKMLSETKDSFPEAKNDTLH